MSRNHADILQRLQLAPIIEACEHINAQQASIFGSSVRKRVEDCGDVDLHIVVPLMKPEVYAELEAAARKTATLLGNKLDRAWHIEWRHGHFKPVPEDNIIQLHLIVDDEVSQEQMPLSLMAYREASAVHLLGHTPQSKGFAPYTRNRLITQAHKELQRWRNALNTGHIPFRHWVFEPTAHLAESALPASTPWLLRCMTKGAISSSNLHYYSALMGCGQLTQLHENPSSDFKFVSKRQLQSWQSFDQYWKEIQVRMIQVLDDRLSLISSLLPLGSTGLPGIPRVRPSNAIPENK